MQRFIYAHNEHIRRAGRGNFKPLSYEHFLGIAIGIELEDFK